ncbi:hypothetical protein J4P02_24835 [Pseudomonas sp. NFXW11]|uniref:hypothetical protein n=1 Tax=Pseudomonas sp. NFXW11 TaxID=2819531 RepID=UPI003CE78DDA
MSQATHSTRTVKTRDWLITYCIGIFALALLGSVGVSLLMLAGNWPSVLSVLPGTLSFGLTVLLLSIVVVGVVAALPCTLFFWLAQRFGLRHLAIYLLCGTLSALPTIPLVMNLMGESYSVADEDQPDPGILERYSPMAPLFGGSGAFLGAVFWWRSGRHLR